MSEHPVFSQGMTRGLILAKRLAVDSLPHCRQRSELLAKLESEIRSIDAQDRSAAEGYRNSQ